eukprot:13791722-Alexandrium_andersonii.AAC.1
MGTLDQHADRGEAQAHTVRRGLAAVAPHHHGWGGRRPRWPDLHASSPEGVANASCASQVAWLLVAD